ncbi:hypothetical protein [Roseivirga pacifica]|uniref:hypothetical protein n=1 Tax=Roseivirga pacifica TaxID=1267423 RepID=UPI003BAE420F
MKDKIEQIQATAIGKSKAEETQLKPLKKGFECRIENRGFYVFNYCIIKKTNITIDDEAAHNDINSAVQTYFDLVGRGLHSDLQPLYLNPSYKRRKPQGFSFK